MNYEQTLTWLFCQLTSFQREGQSAYKGNLDNITEISSRLGNPHKKIKCIHIAGTNGKGSVSHLLASVLQEEGFKVGLYTSPHLKDFRERIKINGTEISEDNVVEFVRNHKDDFMDIGLSFFEMTTALAFSFFSQNKVDIAVIETGLGGRLDATNIILPELSVITNVSLDHQSILGNNLKKIAEEKSGIIKQGIPTVIGETSSGVQSVIQAQAEKMHSKFSKSTTLHNFPCSLEGNYQKENIDTTCQSIKEMRLLGWEISTQSMQTGFLNVLINTGLRGRWEQLSSFPTVICDTGHNLHAFHSILNQLKSIPHKNLWMILGFAKDKDINNLFAILPKDAQYIFCQANVPRSMEVNDIKNLAAQHSIYGTLLKNPSDALIQAKALANSKDLIFVGGSTFVVGEVL
jgi:dihydrofolate synthase/folylpolyglutamate synthase